MPPIRNQPSEVRVLTETESGRGWLFAVSVPSGSADNAAAAEHQISLSWADCEHWAHGVHSASRVVEAVVRAVIAADPERQLPEKFDCSTARRWVRDLDARVRESL